MKATIDIYSRGLSVEEFLVKAELQFKFKQRVNYEERR